MINNNSNSLIEEQLLALVGFSLKARLSCSCGKKRELVNQFGLKENETLIPIQYCFLPVWIIREYLHFHTILKFMCYRVSFCKAKWRQKWTMWDLQNSFICLCLKLEVSLGWSRLERLKEGEFGSFLEREIILGFLEFYFLLSWLDLRVFGKRGSFGADFLWFYVDVKGTETNSDLFHS